EPDMEYRIDLRLWVERTVQLSQSLTEPAAVAPLIVEYCDGVLSARDGNNRHEAMRLKGRERCWVLIWYNMEIDYQKHTFEIKKGALL
ncbi:MAG: hypothetical protein JSV68_02600, partial [Anaerolineaceae bacterium]